MKKQNTKKLLNLLAFATLITFAAGCDSGYEYEEDGRLGIAPESSLVAQK